MRSLKPIATFVIASLLAGTAYAGPAKAPVAPAARTASPTAQAEQLRGGFIIPLVAIVAVILGILAATSGHDRPHSP
jgi:hypothetical protein